eukprot:gene854-952_t
MENPNSTADTAATPVAKARPASQTDHRPTPVKEPSRRYGEGKKKKEQSGKRSRKKNRNLSPAASSSSLRREGSLPELRRKTLSPPPGERYNHLVQEGNNGQLITQLLRGRNVWYPYDPLNEAKIDKYEPDPNRPNSATSIIRRKKMNSSMAKNANLIWTMYRVPAVFDAFRKNKSINLLRNVGATINIEVGREDNDAVRLHNHFENNGVLVSKRGLTLTMVKYYLAHKMDPFDCVPLTFPVKGISDPMFHVFEQVFNSHANSCENKVWILKPGKFENQGFGIECCDDLDVIRDKVEKFGNTMVIQKYMEAPLLINRKKFDIRAYCLATDFEPEGFEAFFFPLWMIRTSQVEFNLKNMGDKLIHLVNDAIQKKGSSYSNKGSNQDACKMSMQEFEKYLSDNKIDLNVNKVIVPQMKNLMYDSMRASFSDMNKNKIKGCFEIFGFDFMVDENFKVWLIEVNTNPSLVCSTSWLSHLKPKMVDTAFEKVIDRFFPPLRQRKVTNNLNNDDGTPRLRKEHAPVAWERIFSSAKDKWSDKPKGTDKVLPEAPKISANCAKLEMTGDSTFMKRTTSNLSDSVPPEGWGSKDATKVERNFKSSAFAGLRGECDCVACRAEHFCQLGTAILVPPKPKKNGAIKLPPLTPGGG